MQPAQPPSKKAVTDLAATRQYRAALQNLVETLARYARTHGPGAATHACTVLRSVMLVPLSTDDGFKVEVAGHRGVFGDKLPVRVVQRFAPAKGVDNGAPKS